MSQPPTLPPANGNSEVEAINQLTLQIYNLNQTLDKNFLFDPIAADQIFWHLIIIFLLGFVGGVIMSVIRRAR